MSSGEILDDALVVAFPEGASFTGEPMVEVQCHGGRAVVMALSDRLIELGCRLAEPGEFARRAYDARRVGLAELEGLADLIAAETEEQRRQAIRIMSGELSDKVEAWRAALLRACALIEVTIDWVDEEVPEDVRPEVEEILSKLRLELDDELDRSRTSGKIRHGLEVAVIGAPNSGKSSFINYLAGRDAAIVSAVPGTTRDVLEVRYDLVGLPIIFLDTAGIREASDEVERMGVDRARARAATADVRVCLEAPDGPETGPWREMVREGDLIVRSKADLVGPRAGLAISVVDGKGIDEVLQMLGTRLAELASGGGLIAHLRHEVALRACSRRLQEVMLEVRSTDPEILAESLRVAVENLEIVVGRIDNEAVLDTVFRSFCLGK